MIVMIIEDIHALCVFTCILSCACFIDVFYLVARDMIDKK